MMSALPRRTLIAWTAGLLSGGAATAINTSGDSVGDALDLSDFLAGGFAATFHEPLSFTPGKVRVQPPRPLTDPSFRWTAGYVHATPAPGTPPYVPAGKPFPAFSWLSSELAVYPNADAVAAAGHSPFRAAGGQLTITADRTPLAMRRLIPQGFAQDYVSGALCSYPFSQTYGYFEMRARIPAGRGLWPAFWMLPVDLSWPPENDVMEVLGNDPSTVFTTVHSRLLSNGTMRGYGTKTVDLSADMHRFGVDWGPERVRYYLDRRLVFSQPTPEDWHAPFYLLANLAVGGPHSWPGAPDERTVFPASFTIAEISAWQRKRYLP
jgi:hypothetical protein